VKRVGLILLVALAALCVCGPGLILHPVATSYQEHVLAPPMPVHFRDAAGQWTAPLVYPQRLVDRLAREYDADAGGAFSVFDPVARGREWFPLGTDSLGRDVWSRLAFGTRLSLGLSLIACAVALLLGTLAGGVAGYAGGVLDAVLMRACEFVMVLPTIYVVLALRAALPLALSPTVLLVAMTAVLAVAGTPQVARAARAVVVSERTRGYVEAARAAGASHSRILLRHLLPACREILVGQVLLLIPAFVLAESTLSFLGLGFDPSVPSWGAMLQDAANVRAISEYPWVLAPAAALACTVLAFNLVADASDTDPLP
jgi:peptide/nickel transport system permease protein